MKGRRHTPEQVVRKLHETDKLLGQDKDLAAGAQAPGDPRADLSPLAQALRGTESRRRQATG